MNAPGNAGLPPGSVLRKTELELGAPRTERAPPRVLRNEERWNSAPTQAWRASWVSATAG